MEKIDRKLDDQRAHTDARLDEIKEHFDSRLGEIKTKVDPMHDYFVTARTGATIIKWLLGIAGGSLTIWATVKGWIKL